MYIFEYNDVEINLHIKHFSFLSSQKVRGATNMNVHTAYKYIIIIYYIILLTPLTNHEFEI